MRYRDRLRTLILSLLLIVYFFGGTLLIAVSFRAQVAREIQSARAEHHMMLYSLLAVCQRADESQIPNLLSQTAQSLENDNSRALCIYQAATEESIYRSPYMDSGTPWLTTPAPDRTAITTRLQNNQQHVIVTGSGIQIGSHLYYVETLHNVEDVYLTRQTLLRVYTTLLPAIIIAGLAAARILSQHMIRPLTALTEVTQAIAAGKLDVRAPVEEGGEIGQLAADFNQMAGQLEANIAELQDSVQRQEDFIASFAHELRTPLTSLIGYADLIRTQELPAEQRRMAAQYIFTEGKRLENLSVKLLDLIVLDKQKLVRVDCRMSRLIADAGGVMHPLLCDANIALLCHPDDTIWQVEPDLIKTLLINLIDNARKAMPDGGTITLNSGLTDEGWQVTVRDTGRGIPAAELPRLTEAFYRVDKSRARAQGGVGLGLTLCARIAALHHGTISIESTEGKGTTVTVLLRREEGAQ